MGPDHILYNGDISQVNEDIPVNLPCLYKSVSFLLYKSVEHAVE